MKDSHQYFILAKSWATDYFVELENSRIFWRRCALYFLIPCFVLALLALVLLMPLQKVTPLMIQHYQNGLVSVEPVKMSKVIKNEEQIKSDIAKYIQFRESYSAQAYDYQYHLIALLSSGSALKNYVHNQDAVNKNSPIHVLGTHTYLTVKIKNIMILNQSNQSDSDRNKHKKNLAQVEFVVTQHSQLSGAIKNFPKMALLSWHYRKPSSNPEKRWMNWDGFSVQFYQVQASAF